jgi:hypothetical protein
MSRPVLARLRVFVAGAAAALCAACGSGSDLDKQLATVRSWTATAHLAVELRRAGATTARYTSQLRDRAVQALEDEHQQLAKTIQTPDARARLRPPLDSLAQAIRSLDEEVGR